MTRLLLIPLALLVLLVVVAALLLPVLLDKDKVLQLATEALHKQTGATLRVDGDATLSVFPTLGISLSDAVVIPPQEQQTDLRELRIGTLQVGVQFFPLIRGQAQIKNITLDGVRARIESAPGQADAGARPPSDEDLDALYRIRRERMASSAQATSTQAVQEVPPALHIKQVIITDARLELLDSAGAAPRVIELVRLVASNVNMDDAPIPVDLSLRVPSKQAIDVNIKGGIRINQQQIVTLDQLDVAVTGALADTLQLRSSGVVDLNRQSADLQLALELGETRGAGTVRYTGFESPQIDSALQFNLLDPALLALAGPNVLAVAGQEPVDSNDQELPLDALRAIDARTVLTVEKARFGAHTVTQLHTRLLALDGVIQVLELTGDLHGGKLKGNGTLNARHNAVTLDTSGSLSQVDLATTLAAMKAKPTLGGSATVNWQLHSQGLTVNALTANMKGPITLTTDEVVLRGMSVEQLLCQPVALSNKEPLTATFPADTRFNTFTADIQMGAGKATFNPLRAAITGVALSGSGNYDLLEKDFDVTFKARLSPELEQLDRACRVSKRLTAIDVPVHCAGTFTAAPAEWCRVDTAKILQDLTVNEGLEKLEKKASKFLDKLFNKGN